MHYQYARFAGAVGVPSSMVRSEAIQYGRTISTILSTCLHLMSVLPLAVTAIQCYEGAQTPASKLRRKNQLFRSLRRKLHGYEAILNLNLDWLLKSIGSDEHLEDSRRTELLQSTKIWSQFAEFLGPEPLQAFHDSILEMCNALDAVLNKIDGFLVAESGAQDRKKTEPLSRVQFLDPDDVKLRYHNGFKLALSAKEIEEYIAKAENATSTINSIRSATTDMQYKNRDRGKSLIGSLVESLIQVRGYANQLHQAVSASWAENCRYSHEISLFLEDRMFLWELDSLSLGSDDYIQFKMVFAAKSAAPQIEISREVLIGVFPSVNDEKQAGVVLGSKEAVRAGSSSQHADQTPQHQISNEVKNVCKEVCNHEQPNTILRLSVRSSSKIYHRVPKSVKESNSISRSTVTLQSLLGPCSTSGLRSGLFPRACTELALTLASALLQLSQTPWFDTFWSKEHIYFAREDGDNAASGTPSQKDVQYVDITQPMVIKPVTGTSRMLPTHPKKVLLEFAILMMELWRGIAIEGRFPDRLGQVQGDDMDRRHLAERWLEEDREKLLGFQFDVVDACLKCLSSRSVPERNLKWDDQEFLRSFAAGVIEPLYRASNKSKP